MKAHNTNKQDLLRDIREIDKNLSRRMGRIRSKENLPQYAVNSYDKLKSRINFKKLNSLNAEELTKVYRNISYINNLKSSTVEGAKIAAKTYEPLKERLATLSPSSRKKIQTLYNKYVEETAGLSDFFKYEILDTETDLFFEGENEEDILYRLTKIFNEAYEGTEGATESKEFKLLFTEKLKKLQDEFE